MCLGPTCKSTGTAIAFQRAFQTNHVNKPSKKSSDGEGLALIRTVNLHLDGAHIGGRSLCLDLEKLAKKHPDVLPTKH